MQSKVWERLLDIGNQERTFLLDSFSRTRNAQNDLLTSILARNADCAFGLEHKFSTLRDIDDFRRSVPIRDYEAFSPWIERISQSGCSPLTSAPPFAFAQTGGSSGGRRVIPYTADTLAAFQRGILAWLADLAAAYPNIKNGRTYFSISPATRDAPRFIGGIPVGLDSDAAYFGPDLAEDVGNILVGSRASGEIETLQAWQERTLAELSLAEDLTLISVWSPTFLTTLLDALEADPNPVFDLLRKNAGLHAKQAAQRLTESLASGGFDPAILWPNLCLVSAWSDASAAPHAAHLRNKIGKIPLQGKGLLATEGLFTLPLAGFPHPLPALRSAFLEFRAKNGDMFLVDELRDGERYEIVVTTPGGLYRYRIGDEVDVAGFAQFGAAHVPMLKFAGRCGNATDLVGEKLDGSFVAECLVGIHGFALLVPMDAAARAYWLVLDATVPDPENTARRVEHQLARNPQYA